VSDQTGCLANGVGPAGAGRNDRVVGAFESIFDRQISSHHIDDIGGYEKRRNFAGTPLLIDAVVVFDACYAADPRAYAHTNSA